MAGLTAERCEACHGGTPVLTVDEVAQLRAELDSGWGVVEGTRLHRRLHFKDFSSAFARATQVAMIAEAEGHHPEMTVGWGHVDIDLITHAVGGLTRNDFIVAAKIDALG